MRRQMRKVLPMVLAICFGFAGGLLGQATANHYAGSHYFPDVSATSPHDQDIGYLYELGVVKGFPDGTYGPGLPVSRDQMASYVTRAAAETYLLTMSSVDWNFFGGYYIGYKAYTDGRITYAEYQANYAAMVWATDAMKYQLGQLSPTAMTAPLAATWLKYF